MNQKRPKHPFATIRLQNLQRRHPLDRGRILSWAEKILEEQRCRACELSILLVNDHIIRAYNLKYRQRDSPTDVLSFPMQTSNLKPPIGRGLTAPVLLGDVMISVERANKESVLWNRTFSTHLLALLIHGILHLLGYDHERSPADARRMHRREQQLLSRIR